MADITLLHNPKCSTSRHAKDVIDQAGADVDVVQYLKTPLDESGLRDLIAKLEDPPSDLVRRDAKYKALGLDDSATADVDAVVATLLAHPELMQRPVIVRGDRAIIGRPKDRVADFIA